jgi:hypothetical protein
MKYMSLQAAVGTLKRFYKNSPDEDSISLEQVADASGRQNNDTEKNKSWIGNKLTHLKHHGLLEPVYSYDPHKTLSGVKLTGLGKEALGRHTTTTTTSTTIHGTAHINTISLESIARDIRVFSKQNPSIKVTLSVELKNEYENLLRFQ